MVLGLNLKRCFHGGLAVVWLWLKTSTGQNKAPTNPVQAICWGWHWGTKFMEDPSNMAAWDNPIVDRKIVRLPGPKNNWRMVMPPFTGATMAKIQDVRMYHFMLG